MVETYKLRVKKLPDDFPLDIVANVAFYDQLPQFEVPNLTIYEQKAVVKAAKKTARAIGHENYAKITRNVTLKRATAGKSELMQFTLRSPTEKPSPTLKYDRDSMLRVLKQVLGFPEELISVVESKSTTKYEKSAERHEAIDKGNDVLNEEQSDESIPVERMPEMIVLNDLSDGPKQESNLETIFGDMAHKDAARADQEKNCEICENSILTKPDVKQLETKKLSPSFEEKLYQNAISDPSKCTFRVIGGPSDIERVQELNGSRKDENSCDRSLEMAIQSRNIGEEPSEASEFLCQGPEVATQEYSPEELKLPKTREPSTSDYLRSFCNSYDDYLSQIYAGFSWHKEMASSSFKSDAIYGNCVTVKSQTINPISASGSKSSHNLIKYDRDQMTLLYQYASANSWPIKPKEMESQRIAENLHIFKDWLAQSEEHVEERVEQRDQLHRTFSKWHQKEIESEDEEVESENDEVEEERCNCWQQYATVFRKYERALEKSMTQLQANQSSSNPLQPWAEYFDLIRRYKNSCKFKE